MKHGYWIIIPFLLVSLALSGCVGGEKLDHNSNNQSMETALDTSEKTPSRTEDTILDISEVTLTDFDKSYLVLVSSEHGSYLYRIYLSYKTCTIEFYELENISADFLMGGTVAVTAAVKNTINEYDYHIFENRFYSLNEYGITEQLDAVTDQWEPGNSIWVLRTEDMQCALTEGAKDLWALAQLLFADRGTGIQHFGPTES